VQHLASAHTHADTRSAALFFCLILCDYPDDFDAESTAALATMQQRMQQQVATMEKRLADRFDTQFEAFNKRLAANEV
jgi:hypothetical protein